jgi:hypothetical protein
MCSSVAVDIERNMMPHAVTSEQLEGLRDLRLHHWKGVLKFSERVSAQEITLARFDKAYGVEDPARHRIVSALEYSKRVHSFQMKQVQLLNDFFPIGDTAEHDNATNL